MEALYPPKRPGQFKDMPDLRIDPEGRLCPAFDSVSVKLFLAPSEEMGVRVVDNFCEEHIM